MQLIREKIYMLECFNKSKYELCSEMFYRLHFSIDL